MAAVVLFMGVQTAAVHTAEAASTTPSNPKAQAVREIKKDIRDIRVERHEAVKNEREQARESVKTIRTTATSTGNTRKEVQKQIKDVRTDAKQNVKDIRADARKDIAAKQMELRRTKLHRELLRMHTRFVAAVERLERLADRIDSRIKKFKEQSRDMSASETGLIEARAKIATAKSDVASIKTAATSTSGAMIDAKETLERVRGAAQTAKESIKTTHEALVQVVNGMKPGRSGTPATSTTESF